MTRKKKMVDRVKFFEVPNQVTSDPSVNHPIALEKVINAWLEETPDVQVVQICPGDDLYSVLIHYRKPA